MRCTGARCWGRQRQSTRRELSSPPTKCNTSTDRSISLRGTWLSSFSICTCHVLLERSCLSVDRLRRQGTQGQQSGDGGPEASCAHSRSLHIDPDRPEAVTGVIEMLRPLLQDHVLGPRQAFDFGDELTIGGRDAVSSSSAVVSDRLGSLSYHKPDHPTLNAAAALGPTSTPPTAVLLRGHRACRRCYLSADLATSPYFYRTDTNRAMGAGGVTRGRSCGKTGPPGTTLSPWYAGGL